MSTMLKIFKIFRLPILTFFFVLPLNTAFAQGLLAKNINVDINSQKISNLLTQISKQGGFQFSYSGKNFPKDSLVTFTANNQPIYKVLTQLFSCKYEYEERRNYIIITPALQRLSFINTDVTIDNNNYSISGIVVNEKTGERLMNTSVYEKEQLVSTITDEHGYFKLKLKSNSLDEVRITASKYAYRDTSLSFLNTVVISNRTRSRIFQHNGREVEATALGRFFTTAAQRIQSINIQDFFANRPYQVSLTPGLSSHGALSSQVVNNFH
jgi:sporulation protein YlmC with PRC-barrel domain